MRQGPGSPSEGWARSWWAQGMASCPQRAALPELMSAMKRGEPLLLKARARGREAPQTAQRPAARPLAWVPPTARCAAEGRAMERIRRAAGTPWLPAQALGPARARAPGRRRASPPRQAAQAAEEDAGQSAEERGGGGVASSSYRRVDWCSASHVPADPPAAAPKPRSCAERCRPSLALSLPPARLGDGGGAQAYRWAAPS